MVPNGWKEVKLGDVISHQKGFAFKSEHYCAEGKRIIRISDTDRNSIHDKSPVYINDNNSAGLERYTLTTGDIILSTVGSRPHLLDSMVGKAVQIPPKDEGALLNQNLVKISPKKKLITNNYLFSMLKKNRFNFFISTLVRGNANQVSITLNELFSYKFLLPTYDEQQKIAKILSTWDKAIATTERLIATSQQQKKALMQQLLTGKKRLVNPETGKVFEGDWVIQPLKNIGRLQAGKFVKASEIFNENNENSYPCYGGNGLRGFTASYTHDGLYSLIGRQGALCGNITLATGKFHATEHAVVVTPYQDIDTKWLYYKLIELDLNQYATGQAQPGLSVKNLDPIEMLVASLKEQQKIASVLTAADKEIELLQAKLAHLKDEKKALMQQLLTGKRRVKVDTTEAA